MTQVGMTVVVWYLLCWWYGTFGLAIPPYHTIAMAHEASGVFSVLLFTPKKLVAFTVTLRVLSFLSHLLGVIKPKPRNHEKSVMGRQ